MRYLVTPEFNNKLTSLSQEGLSVISSITNFVRSRDKNSILVGSKEHDVRLLGKEIYTIKTNDYRVYVSFGSDQDGEYMLFLDIAVETAKSTSYRQFFAVKNPVSNFLLDPNRNQSIDPRRNMTIDPNRNMMIDPHRNMMIDPRRNMMIDPNRNMMIDPHRNMMIDPRRNMMIDPNRNMMINPRRNTYYGGPYVYTTNLQQIGFLVSSNEKVTLIFDMTARFIGFGVKTEQGNVNLFNTNNEWIGFLVTANDEVRLRFDLHNNWTGIIV